MGLNSAPTANPHVCTMKFSKLRESNCKSLQCLPAAEQMGSGLFIKRNPLSKERELQSATSFKRKGTETQGWARGSRAKQTKHIYYIISIKTNKRKPHCPEIDGQYEERKGMRIRCVGNSGGAGKKVTLGHRHALFYKQGLMDTVVLTGPLL